MKIIVCVKQVPDTNQVKINPVTGTLIRDGVPSIINPDDKNALEEAIRLKALSQDVHVTVLCMGPPQAKDALREALAMGADDAVLLSDCAFGGSDTYATATILAAGIRKIGDYDLVLCGRQAIDGDTAQVGPQIGEKLDCAVVTYLEKLTIEGREVVAVRDIGTGLETCRATMPVLFTVTEKFGALRPYEMRRVMKYKNAEPEVLSCDDIGCETARCGFAGSPTSVNKIESVVLAGGAYRDVPVTDEGIQGLVKELIDEHTIG